jgi:acyl carrier protein
MNNRLKNIMSNLFDIPVDDINDNISPENCDQWDSLQHMNLIFAIEEEFCVSLTDDDVLKIKDFISIIDILEKFKQS